jgi:hypothetical protein
VSDFDGVQILALNILNERHFQQSVINEILHDDGDSFEAG